MRVTDIEPSEDGVPGTDIVQSADKVPGADSGQLSGEMSMRTMIIGLFVTMGAAMLAAPEQTIRPGEMTEARVWVQNRNRSEAIPIDLREVNVERPIRVEVANGEPFFNPNPVNVRLARQVWEYKSIVLDTGADPVRALNTEGPAGWETTGVFFVGQDKTTLVLKRLIR